jgi:hypothetical protein
MTLTAARRALQLVLEELSRPAQPGGWYDWAASQLGHAMIGTVAAGVALVAGAPAAWAVAGAITAYAGKEASDLIRVPGWRIARDSLHDLAFVAAGAVLAAGLHGGQPWLFGVAVGAGLAGLLAGVLPRALAALRGGG